MVNTNQQTQEVPGPTSYLSFEQMNIIISFRRLWQQLAMWMKTLLMSIIGNLGNKMAVTDRLFVGVPTQFFDVFSVFYGPQLSQQFRNLLANFIQNGWMLMEAINNKDTEAANTNTVQWYKSADEIATFLARINVVYWDEILWNRHLYQFIRIYIDEMTAAAGGDYQKEVELYDSIEDLAYLMGNYMARGIIARSLAMGSEVPNFVED